MKQNNNYKPTRRTCRDGSGPKPYELIHDLLAENGIEEAAAARLHDLIELHVNDQSRRAAAEAVFAVLERLERVNCTGAALSWLLRATPETQEELAERLGASKQAISKQINALKIHFADMLIEDGEAKG